MKRCPSPTFLIAMVFLIAAGAAGAWAWQKANSADASTRSEKSFLQLLTHKREERPNFDRKTSREARVATEKLIAALKKQHPALDTEERLVADEENGFYQLFLLGEQSYQGTEVSERLEQILRGNSEWNEQATKEALAENAALVEKIERIAAMTERSSSSPEYRGFIDARAGKHGADILLLKARIAAEAADETEALRLVRGAFNLGAHYHDLETGSLLCETVALLIDLTTRSEIMKHILPTLGSPANLDAWKAMMPAPRYSPAHFAMVMRGEWETTARHNFYPLILDPRSKEVPKDGEALARAFAADYSSLVTELKSMDFQQFQNLGGEDRDDFYAHLSPESRGFSDMLSVGRQSWARGYIRAATTVTQHQVAIDLMVLEKSGILLDTSSPHSLTADPVSGSQFIFDPVTRTLSAPDSSMEVNPIVLP